VSGVLDSNFHGGLSSLVSALRPPEGSLRTSDFRPPKRGRTRAIESKGGPT
jgi:hypothetical protein